MWVKLYTSAERKTIRIAVSTVMNMLAKLLQVRILVLVSKRFAKMVLDVYPMDLGREPCDRRVSFTSC